MKKNKPKKIEIENNTYGAMVDIKKRYNLADGDDVIWFLIRKLSEAQTTLNNLQKPQTPPVQQQPQVQTINPIPTQPTVPPVEQTPTTIPTISPPPHYKEQTEEQLPYFQPETEDNRKSINQIHEEIDSL